MKSINGTQIFRTTDEKAAELYHNGDYRTTWFDEKNIRESKEFRRLTLLPMK